MCEAERVPDWGCGSGALSLWRVAVPGVTVGPCWLLALPFVDVKMNLQETDYGNFLQNEVGYGVESPPAGATAVGVAATNFCLACSSKGVSPPCVLSWNRSRLRPCLPSLRSEQPQSGLRSSITCARLRRAPLQSSWTTSRTCCCVLWRGSHAVDFFLLRRPSAARSRMHRLHHHWLARSCTISTP